MAGEPTSGVGLVADVLEHGMHGCQQVIHFSNIEEIIEVLKSNDDSHRFFDFEFEASIKGSSVDGSTTATTCDPAQTLNTASPATAKQLNKTSKDEDIEKILEANEWGDACEVIEDYLANVTRSESPKTVRSDSGNELDNNNGTTEEFLTATDAEHRGFYGHWGEYFLGNFDNAERTLIDTPEKLEAFLPVLLKLKPSTREAPELALDSEGWNLGLHGTLTILQMRIRSLKHTYVFDVLALEGKKMFEAEGAEGQSLKKVLESKEHTQLWWDIRQDTEALFHHYGILIGTRIDVQLMELATRNSPQCDWLRGLASAVWNEGCAWMNAEDVYEWGRKNREAKQYFRRRDYQCFNERPLPDMALEYSAGDVDVIERLYDVYRERMTDERWELVLVETDNRLLRAMLRNKPRHNARAPASFAFLPAIWSPQVVEEEIVEEYTVACGHTPVVCWEGDSEDEGSSIASW